MANSGFEFRSLPGLWQTYQEAGQSLGFEANRHLDRVEWQQRLRSALWGLLGVAPVPAGVTAGEIISVQEEDSLTLQQIVLPTVSGEHLPVHMLIPHQGAEARLKAVIALPGHGRYSAGNLIHGRPQGADPDLEPDQRYARQLAERGYLVFVPELRGLGARIEDPPYREGEDSEGISSCYQVGVSALLVGKTLLGLRLVDLLQVVDHICARPDVSPYALGCVGFSGGGMLAMFAAALDERIGATVVSGYLNTFRDSIMAIRHCLCNYVPGIVQAAEMADIAGLIAPRPLFIESGVEDPIFPYPGAARALAQLQLIYAGFSAGDSLASEVFDGGHRWHGVGALTWLDEQMGK